MSSFVNRTYIIWTIIQIISVIFAFMVGYQVKFMSIQQDCNDFIREEILTPEVKGCYIETTGFNPQFPFSINLSENIKTKPPD